MCVGLNWHLVSFWSHVNKIIIHFRSPVPLPKTQQCTTTYVKYWMIQYWKSGMRQELNIVWILLYSSSLLHLQTIRLSYQECKRILSATFDFIKNSTRCLWYCSNDYYVFQIQIYHFGNINRENMSLLHLNWYVTNCSASSTSAKNICGKTTSMLTCRCE